MVSRLEVRIAPKRGESGVRSEATKRCEYLRDTHRSNVINISLVVG